MTESPHYDEKERNKEIDLLDYNFQLLKKFRELAPGSFKHCQSLASMIENVTSSLDMDSEKLKTAALYHDVGKMLSPEFFSENQPKDVNIHDTLDPLISYYMITKHVSDSIMILFSNNFPLDIIRIISQHHGTTILKSIYDKVKDKKYPEEIFRYKTKNPDNVESLILMFCDSVEANSRSVFLNHKEIENPEALVSSIFNRLMLDGQFNDVELKLGHLTKIQRSITNDVAANFHKRIHYENNEEK